MNSKATEIWNIMNNALRKYMQKYPFFSQETVAFIASSTIYITGEYTSPLLLVIMESNQFQFISYWKIMRVEMYIVHSWGSSSSTIYAILLTDELVLSFTIQERLATYLVSEWWKSISCLCVAVIDPPEFCVGKAFTASSNHWQTAYTVN